MVVSEKEVLEVILIWEMALEKLRRGQNDFGKIHNLFSRISV